MQPEIDVHGIALAEAVGFEPTVGYTPTAVFKTAALNLSATLPEINLASLLNLVLLLVICDRFFDWDVFNPAVLVPNSIHRILSVGKVVGRLGIEPHIASEPQQAHVLH